MFPLDSVHRSFDGNEFQSYNETQEHIDPYFHNEQVVGNDSNFFMHYESKDVEFFFPNEMIEDANLIGESNGTEVSILSQEYVNENHVYDTGKKFC